MKKLIKKAVIGKRGIRIAALVVLVIMMIILYWYNHHTPPLMEA